MKMKSIEYLLPRDAGVLRLEGQVVEYIFAYRQNRFWKTEAGGQLFAFHEPGLFRVAGVTGPRPTDRRTVCSYQPDRAAEQAEIAEYYRRDMHFVGDWHTHSQRVPRPSRADEESTLEIVRQSRHVMLGAALIIVGTKNPPEGISAFFATKERFFALK